LKTEVSKEVPLEEFEEAAHYYIKNMTAGKVIFKPQLKNIKDNTKENLKEMQQ